MSSIGQRVLTGEAGANTGSIRLNSYNSLKNMRNRGREESKLLMVYNLSIIDDINLGFVLFY